MKKLIIGLIILMSSSVFAKSDFKNCDAYLNKRVEKFPISPNGKEYTKIDLFNICVAAKPGFTECQKIVDDAHGNNRLYLNVCLEAQKGIKDCVSTYAKRFTHPSRTYSAESDLDAIVRICTGNLKLDTNLTTLKH